MTFAGAATIQNIFGHVLGGGAGETFTIALYDDSPAHLPGNERFTSTATFGSDGWNGVSGLSGWTVGPGVYWIAFEIGVGDTLGQSSDTGALLDVGAPAPLSRTAFNPGSGYVATSRPLGFGLQVDAAVVTLPEPPSVALLFAGLAAGIAVARRTRR